MESFATESIRPIKALVEEYVADVQRQRPISVAIFGPRRTGKTSFAFNIAREVGQERVEVVHLDLAELRDADQLTSALLLISRRAGIGRIPFIIVDEFDAKRRDGSDWIPSFLGPMTGAPLNATQRLDRAIFVFISSSARTMEAFANQSGRSKIPDFVARLSGYANLDFPDTTAQFKNVCKIIVPDFEQINKEMLEYFAAKPEALQDLDWRKFEILLEAVFRNQGYKTVLGPGRGDDGVDIRLLQKDSIGAITTLVQAKRYTKEPIKLQAVQALSAAVYDERANRGLFVTTSRYLPVAQRFAARQSTRLSLATSADVARWCEEASRLWPRVTK